MGKLSFNSGSFEERSAYTKDIKTARGFLVPPSALNCFQVIPSEDIWKILERSHSSLVRAFNLLFSVLVLYQLRISKIKVIGKLGEITLANRQAFDESHEGVVLVQGSKTFNTPTISKKTIETLVQKKERLFYTFNLSYSDWEDYEQYEYSVIYEVFVNPQKKPLEFSVRLVPYIP